MRPMESGSGDGKGSKENWKVPFDRMSVGAGCSVWIVAMALMVAIFFGTGRLSYRWMEHKVVASHFGEKAYSQGLRFTKRGVMTDGQPTPGYWYGIVGVASFLISVPPTFAYAFLLMRLGVLNDNGRPASPGGSGTSERRK